MNSKKFKAAIETLQHREAVMIRLLAAEYADMTDGETKPAQISVQPCSGDNVEYVTPDPDAAAIYLCLSVTLDNGRGMRAIARYLPQSGGSLKFDTWELEPETTQAVRDWWQALVTHTILQHKHFNWRSQWVLDKKKDGGEA